MDYDEVHIDVLFMLKITNPIILIVLEELLINFY